MREVKIVRKSHCSDCARHMILLAYVYEPRRAGVKAGVLQRAEELQQCFLHGQLIQPVQMQQQPDTEEADGASSGTAGAGGKKRAREHGAAADPLGGQAPTSTPSSSSASAPAPAPAAHNAALLSRFSSEVKGYSCSLVYLYGTLFYY
jgi:hypothetical protein